MKPLSVEEDLLEFFEVEPIRVDRDIPWIYDNSADEVGDSLRLRFGVTPSFEDVSLELKTGDDVLYKLGALGVKDVLYHKDKRGEALQVIMSDKQSVWLRIMPRISIWQSYEGEP